MKAVHDRYVSDPEQTEEQNGWGEAPYKNAFLMEHKRDYVKKPKHYDKQDPDFCIICNIVTGDEETTAFEIYRTDHTIIFLNLFPYTTGHLLLSPIRHIEGYDDLTPVELTEISQLIQKSLRVLKHFGGTKSFNAGWNQGQWSGGSIRHFHAHLVPRYRTDINFIDIIGQSRTVLQSLESVQKSLLRYVPYFEGKKSLEEISTE